MGPVQAVLSCLRNYADFSGRASPAEYWWFRAAMTVLVAIAASLWWEDVGRNTALAALLGLLYLLMLPPGIAVTVRRLHDMNRSAWFSLVLLLPWVGFIAFPYPVAWLGWKAGLANQCEGLGCVGAAVALLILGVVIGGLVGWSVQVVVLARPGTDGPNRYGSGTPTKGTTREKTKRDWAIFLFNPPE